MEILEKKINKKRVHEDYPSQDREDPVYTGGGTSSWGEKREETGKKGFVTSKTDRCLLLYIERQ